MAAGGALYYMVVSCCFTCYWFKKNGLKYVEILNCNKKIVLFLKKGLANLDTRVLRFLAAHILASSIKNIGACLIGNTMWEYNARPSRNRWPMGFLGDV